MDGWMQCRTSNCWEKSTAAESLKVSGPEPTCVTPDDALAPCTGGDDKGDGAGISTFGNSLRQLWPSIYSEADAASERG